MFVCLDVPSLVSSRARLALDKANRCNTCLFGSFPSRARLVQDCVSACLVPPQIPKECYSICHIECLRSLHGSLNVDEKKLIAQFGGKLRDERFEPN